MEILVELVQKKLIEQKGSYLYRLLRPELVQNYYDKLMK